jgi:hypothetical protein
MNLQENIKRIKEVMSKVNEDYPQVTQPPLQYKWNIDPKINQSVSKDNTTFNSITQTPEYFELNKKIGACKKKVTQDELNKAINWWNKWLDNPKTKERFGKNYGISQTEVNSIFQDYKDAIKGTTIEYKYEPNSSYWAYVSENRWTELTAWNFSKTIKINCKNSGELENGSNDTWESIFVHELQHVIDIVKPFNPISKTKKDFNINSSNLTGIAKEIGNNVNDEDFADKYNKIYDYLFKQGMTIDLSIYWANWYLDTLKNKDSKLGIKYVENPNEDLSRLEGLRNFLHKESGENITLKDIIYAGENNDLGWLIVATIRSGKTIQQILNSLNTYAINDINNKSNNA